MTDAEPKLTAKEEKALAALLEQPTVRDAAQAAGISEATLWRYLRDAGFAARYALARQEVTKHLICVLQHNSTKAAAVLLEVAEDQDAPAGARVSAARAIIEGALRGAELHDLMTRIDALEMAQKGRL